MAPVEGLCRCLRREAVVCNRCPSRTLRHCMQAARQHRSRGQAQRATLRVTSKASGDEATKHASIRQYMSLHEYMRTDVLPWLWTGRSPRLFQACLSAPALCTTRRTVFDLHSPSRACIDQVTSTSCHDVLSLNLSSTGIGITILAM